MRKVLLTVVSAALMGASTLSGAVVQNAFAQTQAGGTLADATALEERALTVCLVDEAEFRSILTTYSALMAQLVANGTITEAEALARFQALRDAARAANCGSVVDAVFEELFPNTAATAAAAPGAPIDLSGPSPSEAVVNPSPT
jgi:3-hydroxyacyl-CoA dehydrogenase